MRQRPRRRGGRRNRDARRQPDAREPPLRYRATSPRSPPNRCATPLTSSRSPSAIHFDQRRPAPRPARKPLDQRRIACRIGGHRDQRRVERPRIGQPRAGPCAALGGGLGHGMDDRPVGALDGQDDRRLRRTVAGLRPALDRQPRQPDGSDPLHARASSGPAACLARGTARRPTPAIPARAGRADWPATARSQSASASARR